MKVERVVRRYVVRGCRVRPSFKGAPSKERGGGIDVDPGVERRGRFSCDEREVGVEVCGERGLEASAVEVTSLGGVRVMVRWRRRGAVEN